MKLKQIDIRELNNLEEICFHFTPKINEYERIDENGKLKKGIAKAGLEPDNENDLKAGYNKPKQVYFSRGQEAALSLMNRYLNLLVGKSPTSVKLLIKPNYMSKERCQDDTPLTKSEVFEYMNKFLKDNMYLAVDLKEGEDFDPLAINPESKSGNRVTPRNMNTFADKVIPQSKIRKLMLEDNSDALSILTYLYDKYMEKGNKEVNTYGMEEEQLIGEFIDYVKSRKLTQANHDLPNEKEIIKQNINHRPEYTITPNQIGKETINVPRCKKVEADNAEVAEKINTIDKGDVNLDDN